MGKQSTRHRYRTRREKNQAVARIARILLIGGVVFFLLLLIKNWREWWAYYKTYFY
ncbi:hypothetical protein [Neolewinella litorea]|uniref:hypothetical protein n=1 Tax=Neolewinella litorea TaxID=2562452 RepID=UPI0014561DEF|nr:hypothetical protein [Neolewinella litorea]